MPMSGSNYVAPTWVDNAPPALDATELQAICNTIQKNQDNISSLFSELGGTVNCETGTYVGRGTSGSSNPNAITFQNVPKVVFISSSDEYGRGIFINGAKPFISSDGNSGNYSISVYGSSVEWSGKTLTWWSSGTPKNQLNDSGVTYTYRSFF